jgi:hypothetical protein
MTPVASDKKMPDWRMAPARREVVIRIVGAR